MGTTCEPIGAARGSKDAICFVVALSSGAMGNNYEDVAVVEMC